MKSLYPCIWMNKEAKDATEFYCSIFPDAKIEESNLMVTLWSSGGEKFMCLNGGPQFQPNPAISFYTVFEKEEDIQQVWDGLIEGGKALMSLDSYPWSKKYGWVQDKYGVNWQLDIQSAEPITQRFAPALMFTGTQFGRAEEAIEFYSSVFPKSSTRLISRYDDQAGGDAGKINHARFLLNGQLFVAMDSSFDHQFNFTEGMSIVVPCEDQQEVDFFWEKFTEDGQESMCGWLKDKFGVSWQIVPTILPELISDPEKGQRVVNAFMKMKKFDIEALQNA